MFNKNWRLIFSIGILFNIVLLLSSFNSNLYDEKIYLELYEKNDVSFNESVKINKTSEIIGFFSDKNSLDNSFFTDAEISHMKDVKKIFTLLNYIYYISFIILVIFLIYLIKKNILIIILPSVILGIILALVTFFIFSIIPFSTSFDGMHNTIFPQGNYSFPADSNLIQLFPIGFFYGFIKLVMKEFFFKEILIISISLGYFYYVKNIKIKK
ncbi:hypothetical protein C0585_01605 [Candidatus Woesearchaeota archaeon]|nr:MAG: hypothetical protein C0585_01605 [Candidatus Woesearchaeota archaeon]